MNLQAKIKLLLEWSPVINYVLAISSAQPGKDRVYRSLELLDYLATKTPTPVDNDLLMHTRAVLLTPQGGALLDYLAHLVQPLLDQPPQ
jgi:hypothetical protein